MNLPLNLMNLHLNLTNLPLNLMNLPLFLIKSSLKFIKSSVVNSTLKKCQLAGFLMLQFGKFDLELANMPEN